MTKQSVHADELVVEVYMADQSPPALYDFYIARSGSIRRTPAAVGIPGLIQVILAGTYPPTPRQQLKVRRQFGLDDRFRVLKFY